MYVPFVDHLRDQYNLVLIQVKSLEITGTVRS